MVCRQWMTGLWENIGGKCSEGLACKKKYWDRNDKPPPAIFFVSRGCGRFAIVNSRAQPPSANQKDKSKRQPQLSEKTGKKQCEPKKLFPIACVYNCTWRVCKGVSFADLFRVIFTQDCYQENNCFESVFFFAFWKNTPPRSALDGKKIKTLVSTLIFGQKFSVTSSDFHVYG